MFVIFLIDISNYKKGKKYRLTKEQYGIYKDCCQVVRAENKYENKMMGTDNGN